MHESIGESADSKLTNYILTTLNVKNVYPVHHYRNKILSKVELIRGDGTAVALTNGNQYAQSGTTFAIPANNITTWLNANPACSQIKLTFSDTKSETITLQK